MYDDIFDMHERSPEEFQRWLRNLVLFEPDTELYLLDANGTVLAKTGPAPLQAGTSGRARRRCASRSSAATPSYVMGDDPERMDADAVIVAKPVRRAEVAQRRAGGRLPLPRRCTRSSCPRAAGTCCAAASPGRRSAPCIAVVALTTLLAVLIIATVTRPLRRLTRGGVDAVAARPRRRPRGRARAAPLPAPTQATSSAS